MTPVPSPATTTVHQLTDEGIASYVEFPEDTFFLESLAQNDSFRSGIAYVPVQRLVNGREESHLYEVAAGMTDAKHIAGPLATPDGDTDVTIFGCCMTSAGILYMCAFNRNSILSIDLKKLLPPGSTCTSQIEIPNLASPNDVCLDPQNEDILYVAGGTFRAPGILSCCGLLGGDDGIVFSNSAYGKVYKVNTKMQPPAVSIQADGLNTLAGIEVLHSEIWLAQLFNVVTQKTSGGPSRTVWKGNTSDGQVWLADNIDVFDDNYLLCPAYSTISESIAKNVMQRKGATSAFLFYTQISTAFQKGESFRDALLDPEVALSFSNTFINEEKAPAPVRFYLQNANDPSQVHHFEIDLKETRSKYTPREIIGRDNKVLGKRHHFNEQVTHAAQLKGADGKSFVVCVNFEQPRLLLLDDAIFRSKIN